MGEPPCIDCGEPLMVPPHAKAYKAIGAKWSACYVCPRCRPRYRTEAGAMSRVRAHFERVRETPWDRPAKRGGT